MASNPRTDDHGTGSLAPHFYSIDILRGLTALIVVLFHWQHFFVFGVRSGEVRIEDLPLPLSSWLMPLYTGGYRCVDLFFCISGFIFYWLYAEKITTRRCQGWSFFVHRFSRLYPLQLLTLVLVAIGQGLYSSRTGLRFVFQHDSFENFLLNLVLATHWSPNLDLSFNGPAWSVSVEVLLYFVFYGLCRWGPRRRWLLVLMIVIGEGLHPYATLIARGLISFFAGGLSYHALVGLLRQDPPRWVVVAIASLTALGWLVIPQVVNHASLVGCYDRNLATHAPTISGCSPLDFLVHRINARLYELILFPMTVFTLALIESRRGSLGKRLGWIGHLSYSSYLWHFPLQLGFVLLGSAFAAGSSFYQGPWSLALFFGILIPLSFASYHVVERPAQAYLRGRMLPGRPAIKEQQQAASVSTRLD